MDGPGRSGRDGASPGVRRKTVVDQMADALREKILSGELPEEAPLRQDKLAERLNGSRIPVREALRQLEVEGLVDFNPHRGAVVSSLSVDEIREIFELRTLLERDLMERAVGHMTADAMERAREVLDAYDEAFERRDIAEWGALNWAFHSTLYAPAGRPLTMEVVRRLHSQSDRYVRIQIKLTEWETRANQEHRAILEAAEAGEAERASELLEGHVRSAGESLLSFLQNYRPDGKVASRSA